MQFNRYIFDLYLQSSEGKENLKIWKEFLDWKNWNRLDFELLAKNINSSLLIEGSFENVEILLKSIKDEILEPIFSKQEDSEEFLNWKNYSLNIKDKFGFENDQQIIEDAKLFWQDELKEIILNDGKDREKLGTINVYAIYLTILNPHFFFPQFFFDTKFI
jgi:hypothetical protein